MQCQNTVIRENFVVKKFVLSEVTKIFLRENSLPILTYTANNYNIMARA